MKEKTYKCNNCGQVLSAENVRLAVEESHFPVEELRLCCPLYTHENGCPGYAEEDKEKPAYW